MFISILGRGLPLLMLAGCVAAPGGDTDTLVTPALPLSAPESYVWTVQEASPEGVDAYAIDLDEDGDVLIRLYREPGVRSFELRQADGSVHVVRPVDLDHASSLELLRMNEDGLAIGSIEWVEGPDIHRETLRLDLSSGAVELLPRLEALDINASGDVLAHTWGTGPPVVWSGPGEQVELPLSPNALLDDGSVVGSLRGEGTQSQAARWVPGLGVLLLEGGGTRAGAAAAGPDGWPIVGTGVVEPGLSGSIQWDRDGSFHVLPPLAVRWGSRVNGSGWLVGSGDMLVHDGVAYDIGTLVGEDLEAAVAINERGQILATRRGELRQAVVLTPSERR